jgi:hypothetical protein
MRCAFVYDSLIFVRFRHLLGWVIADFRSREELLLENLALRQQPLALHASDLGRDSAVSTNCSGLR